MQEFAPLITVLVVVRNGSHDILGVLESIALQQYSPLEVLVIDGMSKDGTRELVEQYAVKQPSFPVRLLDNPGLIQATGWNVGIRAAAGEYILRIDAVHCRLGPQYIRYCLDTFMELRQTCPDLAAVGGRRISAVRTLTAWPQAIALAQSCRFGVGNAGYRVDKKPGFKDTLGVPLYDRHILRQVGLFDESLGRSEDNDFHSQLRNAGFKLYFTPDVFSLYHPRTTLPGVASQMFHNGRWVSTTVVQKHSFPFGVRHIIPFAFYLILLATLFLLSISDSFLFRALFWIQLTGYVATSLAAAFYVGRRLLWRVAVVFWVMHFCYAVGTACGLLARDHNDRAADTDVITASGAAKSGS